MAREGLFEELISKQRPEEDSFGKSLYVRQSKHPQCGENLACVRNKKVSGDQETFFQLLFEGCRERKALGDFEQVRHDLICFRN